MRSPLPSADVRKLAVLGAVGLGLFFLGSSIRKELGFEFSLEGLAAVREWVEGLGWVGIAVFVGLVTFRSFLLLPSHVVLILGGLAFGALGGTLWGGLGLAGAALLWFGAARVMGDEWVRPRLGEKGRAIEERVRRAGPGVVWASTAHPAGPQTPVNLAAGLASMPFWEFALAILLSVPLRAALYSFLGASILSWGVGTFASVTLGLGALLLLPLAIPSVRVWVLGGPSRLP
jgi:uncharacterized membrane protein YdjX (TVP38/TMEM64 family)